MPFNSRHSNREYAGGSVNGILRKGNHNVNTTSNAYSAGEARQVDLLVFGYACKIFRDDDKARDIDHGKHLIPWMGDENLKIDRYDVRGALSELTPYEPPPGGYGNRLDYLTPDEQRAEQLCEEERYLFLYNNEEELILQQEEDLKRLKQESDSGGLYNQVGFQYDNIGVQIGPNPENSINGDEPEQAFVLPRNFEVPTDLRLPETMKQHAIIEKTARFIASQGAQMEILLKAKQSNNVQFEFLTQDSFLNPYYKFVLNSFKNGTYPEDRLAQDPSTPNDNDSPSRSSPFLSSAFTNEDNIKPVITVPTIKYKPSANCAYTQLISKIKGVPLPTVIAEGTENTSDSNTPNTPVLLQYNGNTYIPAENDDSNSVLNNNSNGTNTTISATNIGTTSAAVTTQPQVEVLKNSSALALAQGYSSCSDSEDESNAHQSSKTENEKNQPLPQPEPEPEPILTFPIPTENLKNIIDKTAVYVIKNGRQFEETLRSKSDERFTFLLFENEYYPYYLYKITGDPNAASKEEKKRKAQAVAAALMSKKQLLIDKTVSPVCFSIKPKDDLSASSLPPALPQEPSDEEEDLKIQHNLPNRSVPESVQKAIKLVESQLMARNAQLNSKTIISPTSPISTLTALTSPLKPQILTLNAISGSALKNPMCHTKAEIERNALFEQQQQNRQKEMKKAEEKVKDKLAQIAREKLGGLLSKEKQLQLERKRKAMAFLNQIKGTSNEGSDTNISGDKQDSNDSDNSIRSIPITSYGPEDKSDDDNLENIQTPPAPSNSRKESKSKTLTVTLSDDDDVELISDTRNPKKLIIPKSINKRRSRSRTRDKNPPIISSSLNKSKSQKNYRKRSAASSHSASDDVSIYSSGEKNDNGDADDDDDRLEKRKYRSKSSTSTKKSKKSSSTKSKSKRSKKKSKKSERHRSRSRSPQRHHSRSHRYSRSTSPINIRHKTNRKRSCSHSSDDSSSTDSHYSNSYRSRDYKTAEKVSSSSSRKHKEKKRKNYH